ncbi:hypothetical protein JW948_11185 [bacterium]|nr:hypothetical protein [bacterium]
MNKYFLILIICSTGLLANSRTSSIQAQLRFDHLTIDQGLAHNKVNCICQDSEGFMWFGTNEGLSKYDGLSVINFRHDPGDSNSLTDNLIKNLIVDRQGNLWIGVDGRGLMVYNRDQNNFTELKYDSSVFHHTIALFEDAEGKIWTSSSDTLFCLDSKTRRIEGRWKFAESPEDNLLLAIYEDSKSNLWIGTQEDGLYRFDRGTGQFTPFRNDPADATSISGNAVNAIFEDGKGNLWIGTNDHGLNLYNARNSGFIRLDMDRTVPRSSRVRGLAEDDKGNLWIGTRGGLYLKDPESMTFRRYAHSEHDFSRLTDNSIYDLYIDCSQVLWIGTYAGGTNFADLNQKAFVHYSAERSDPYYLNNNIVFSLCEDRKGNLWIGTENGGLNYLDRETDTFSYLMHQPDRNSVSSNNIKSIICDGSGNLWIGTYQGGLEYYNIRSNSFLHHRHDPENPNSPVSDNIYDLLLDNERKLWIATQDGLDQYDTIRQTFRHMSDLTDSNWDRIRDVRMLVEDSRNRLWIGTYTNGLYILDKSSLALTPFHPGFANRIVHTVCEDSEHNTWIGGEGGLYYMKGDSADPVPAADRNGLLRNTILGILEDNQGDLWISTSSVGLIRLANAVHDPENLQVRHYDIDDGIQSRQFTYNAYMRGSSGELFFGGINGFNAFDPEAIRDNPFSPKVTITDLKLFNESVSIGQVFDNHVILEKPVFLTDRIRLTYKAKSFSLEFAAFHYAHPLKNVYMYKMKGLEDKWNLIGTQRSVNFTSLDPGDYTFMIKAANPDGLWNDEGASVVIRISPPFWATLWFRILFIGALLGTGIGVYKFRTRTIKKQKELLEKEVVARTEEVLRKKEEIEKAYNRMNQAVGKINEGVDKIKSLSNTVAEASSEFNETSQRMATGAAEHASSISEISSSLQELFTSASANAVNAQEADTVTVRLHDIASDSLADMKNLSGIMKRIHQSTHDTETVIQTMEEIATMLQILSINASIEAMRAGEYGKGFQAVAKEVQELADKSETAVQSTKILIHGAIEHVEKGTKINQDMVKRFKVVGQFVERVTEFMRDISAASVQQKLGIDQINHGVSQLHGVMQMSSDAVHVTVQHAETLSSNADTLRDLVNVLTEAVSHLIGE